MQKGNEKQKKNERQKENEKRKQRVKNVQMGLWVILILLQMAVVNCLEVRAEPSVNAAPKSRDEFTVRHVQKDVVYEHVEGGASLPETLDVRIEEGGVTVTAVCALEEKAILRERWEDSFSFPVTFHSYDAAFYQLGDILIPFDEERPRLEGSEERLLELVGVTPEEYQITSVRWAGEAYQGEEGELCRDALATGNKLVRDYRVRYAGTAQIPVKPEPRSQTGAEETVVEQTPEAEEAVVESETEMRVQVESSGEAQPQAEAGEPLTLWQKITRTLLVVIGIGALLFFGGLLILALLLVVKKLRKWYTGQKRKRAHKRGNKEDH